MMLGGAVCVCVCLSVWEGGGMLVCVFVSVGSVCVEMIRFLCSLHL